MQQENTDILSRVLSMSLLFYTLTFIAMDEAEHGHTTIFSFLFSVLNMKQETD